MPRLSREFTEASWYVKAAIVLVLVSLVAFIVMLISDASTTVAGAPFIGALGIYSVAYGFALTEGDRRRKLPGMVVWRRLLNQLPLRGERAVWVALGCALTAFAVPALVRGR